MESQVDTVSPKCCNSVMDQGTCYGIAHTEPGSTLCCVSQTHPPPLYLYLQVQLIQSLQTQCKVCQYYLV